MYASVPDGGPQPAGPTRWQGSTGVWLPGHFTGTGFDKAGNLHGYTVEIYREHDGKYLYRTEYELDYRKGETYQLIEEIADSYTTVHNIALPQHGETTRTYNVNGELVAFVDERNNSKNRFFANDAQGQVLTAVQGDFDSESGRPSISQAFTNATLRSGAGVKAQHFFSANGQTIGSFGQLTDENNAFKANFDINYTPVSSSYPSDAPGQYVVQAGDTLRTVAARIFGDASLWYVIAEENGLTDADAALDPGLALRITNNVTTLSNAAGSFKPFDRGDALGETTPTQPPPKPKKSKWGILGQILIAIVALVVAYFTGIWVSGLAGGGTTGVVVGSAVGAAAGSAASQGVAITLDMQDHFSWKAVGAAALTALIAPRLPGDATAWDRVLNAAAGSAVNQGVNIALGLQDSFNWAAVAASAVAAPIANQVGSKVGGAVSQAVGSATVGDFANRFTQGVINQVAYSSFTGGQLNYAQMAADAFGNALGNSIVDGMRGPSTTTTNRVAQNGGTTSGQIYTDAAIGSASGAASLSNNPTDTIYQPGMAPTPDELRVIQASYPSSIEGVLVTAPTWKPGEERIYQQLINSSIFGWGRARDEDRAAAQAQSIYNHDIRLQNPTTNPLPAVVRAIGSQLIQPVLQVADLGLAGRGLIQNKLSDWTGGWVPSFDAQDYYVSDVGRVAANGGGITETLPLGLQSSTLGSVGYYSHSATSNVIAGNYAAAAWDVGAVGVNFIGAQGVSSAPALLRQLEIRGAGDGSRLASQQGFLNVDAFVPNSTLPDAVTFEGALYRSVGAGHDPLLIHPSSVAASHRYTGSGQGGLYFATGRHVVEAEIVNNASSLVGRQTHAFPDQAVSDLLDLSNPAVRGSLGVNLSDLTRTGGTQAWRYEVTQPLGMWAQQSGYRGIIAPSAQADGGLNLILFSSQSIR